MIPSSILNAERELRRAIERRQSGAIPQCLLALREIAGNQLKSFGPGDPVRVQTCQRVLSLLEWSRLMLQTQRARLAEDLRLLGKTDRFLAAKMSDVSRLRLDL